MAKTKAKRGTKGRKGRELIARSITVTSWEASLYLHAEGGRECQHGTCYVKRCPIVAVRCDYKGVRNAVVASLPGILISAFGCIGRFYHFPPTNV